MTETKKIFITVMIAICAQFAIGQDVRLRGVGRNNTNVYYVDNKETCISILDTALNRIIFTLVDTMPEYPGGNSELLSFFGKNFVNPKELESFQASFFLSFVVEEDGKLSNITVYKRQLDKSLSLADREAIRVFQIMPNWKAGKCEGKKVAVKMMVPIRF